MSGNPSQEPGERTLGLPAEPRHDRDVSFRELQGHGGTVVPAPSATR
jgi:hypothetical protein